MKTIKLAFGLSNFMHQNEPAIAAMIGNIAMILGIIASIPVILSTGGVAVPAVLVALSAKATAGLLITKSVTKMFGMKDVETGSPVNTTLPSTIEK